MFIRKKRLLRLEERMSKLEEYKAGMIIHIPVNLSSPCGHFEFVTFSEVVRVILNHLGMRLVKTLGTLVLVPKDKKQEG